MRIVAGILGGRRLKSPPGSRVRPTPDKVREALFSILGDRVAHANVLDLFAGTGALGLEALSRGARHVHFVERAARVRSIIRTNVESLGVSDQVDIVAGSIPICLPQIARGAVQFNLIFADPPYGKGYPEALLQSAALIQMVDPDGMLIIEHPRGEDPRAATWVQVDARQYGDSSLAFLQLERGHE